MWLLIDFILNLLINMIIIFPVFAIAKELFPVPGIDAFWTFTLPLLHIPINKNSIFIAELASLILLVCFLWGFVFPYFPVTRFFQRKLRGQSTPIPLDQDTLTQTNSLCLQQQNINTLFLHVLKLTLAHPAQKILQLLNQCFPLFLLKNWQELLPMKWDIIKTEISFFLICLMGLVFLIFSA